MTGDRVAIVIPAHNEEKTIEATLRHVQSVAGEAEIVVVENGSADATYALSSRLARTIQSLPGRGEALNAGAAHTSAEAIVFLHADTQLPEGAIAAVTLALTDPETVGGCFSIRFAGADWRSSLVGLLYRTIAGLGYFYGDSAIFVRRSAFEKLGGFKPTYLMEDLDFCLRLRKVGRTVRLAETVVSSDRRWREQGFAKTALTYLFIQGFYLLGVRNDSLYRRYKPVR